MLHSFMPKNKPLSARQDAIISFLEETNQPAAMSAMLNHLESLDSAVSRMTINRDVRELVDLGYVTKQGDGRGVVYVLSPSFSVVKPINTEAYFKVEPDKRAVKQSFNFSVFSLLDSIFSSTELQQLEIWNETYRQNVKKLSPTVLKREYERLTIELSWKSSHIEGNTYTLLETDYLLSQHKEPKGHTREETAMILNHKIALDYIRAHADQFKILNLRKIEEIHSLLIKDLGVERNIRKGLVGIAGTAYRPLDNAFQIREAIEKMCAVINKQRSIFAKAILALLIIAYIQPFEDGNKRTSRLIGNALLIAHRACPLSFRSIDELEYKKAILIFYEQNNFHYFKQLFMEQFEFAVKNYFG